MSHDDPYRPDGGRERGAYTPPDADDLPFQRSAFDARRAPAGKAPPVTLLVSAGVLLVLILVVVLFYRSGLRSSEDAPPAVGTPVGNLKVEAPVDAQPIDPAEGVDLYEPAPAPTTPPTFVPPPEAVAPRPAPAPAATPAPAPRPRPVTPAPAPAETTPAPAAGGTASVQIGAFSTPGIADREYAAIAGRYPQFTRGAGKRVQEVTASNGATLYRTTVTGLSREDARAMCAAIRASGGDCIVR